MIKYLLIISSLLVFINCDTLLDGLNAELGNAKCEFKCKPGLLNDVIRKIIVQIKTCDFSNCT